MKKSIALILAIVLAAAIPFSAGAVWVTDEENSFSEDFSAYEPGPLTADNIHSVLGEGWELYHVDNIADVSAEIVEFSGNPFGSGKGVQITNSSSTRWRGGGLRKHLSSTASGKVQFTATIAPQKYYELRAADSSDNHVAYFRTDGNNNFLLNCGSSDMTLFQYTDTVPNVPHHITLDFDLPAGTVNFTLTYARTGVSMGSLHENLIVSEQDGITTVQSKTPFSIGTGKSIATVAALVPCATNTISLKSIGVTCQNDVDTAILESDSFDGDELRADWVLYTDDGGEGTIEQSDEYASSAPSSIKVTKTDSNRWKVVAAEKAFDTAYDSDVLIEASFKGERYSGIEVHKAGGSNTRIAQFYIAGAAGSSVGYGSASTDLLPVAGSDASGSRWYTVSYLIHPAEGTMDLTVTYPWTENDITAYDGFSAVVENGLAVIRSVRPIKITSEQFALTKIRLAAYQPSNNTAYFDDYAVKTAEYKPFDVRTAVLADADGNKYNQMAEGNSYTLTTSMINSGEAPAYARIIIAQYDADGVLKAVSTQSKEIAANATGEAAQIAVPFTVAAGSAGDTVRVFAWDDSCHPLFDGYSYIVQPASAES